MTTTSALKAPWALVILTCTCAASFVACGGQRAHADTTARKGCGDMGKSGKPKDRAMQPVRALASICDRVKALKCSPPDFVTMIGKEGQWQILLEWPDGSKASDWRVNLESGEVRPGPCKSDATSKAVDVIEPFVRVLAAAVAAAPRYSGDPGNFDVAISDEGDEWNVAFSPKGSDSFGGGEMVVLDRTTFKVLESKLTQ
jgi:hypothetical protein